MIYLLDTNIVSEAAKETPDPSCLTWLKAARTNCGLSTITLAELRYGIERRAEGKEKARLAQAFQFLVEDYRAQIFDFDWAAASEWGRYAAELLAAHGADWWKTFDQRDTMIAAIARENGLTVDSTFSVLQDSRSVYGRTPDSLAGNRGSRLPIG